MNHLHRFFVEDLSPERVMLMVEEAHHALNVLRLGEGEQVELFDGKGSVARGRITEAKKAKVAIAVDGRWRIDDRAPPLIHLAFAVPKGKRLDWLLEKATELGAASLTPVLFERSVSGMFPGRPPTATRQRWLAHCVAAAKQSGLNWLPELRDPVPLEELLERDITAPTATWGLWAWRTAAAGR